MSLANHCYLRQVRRIKLVRAYTRSRRNSASSDAKPSNLRPRIQADIQQNLNTGLRHRFSAALLGVKGSFLRQSSNGQTKDENPVARLKLLLVSLLLLTYLSHWLTVLEM